MKSKKTAVVPLATALASLATGANATAPAVQLPDQGSRPTDSQKASATNIQANTIFKAGEDLLGLLVTRNADGTVVAQHASHMSHASHASHASHHSHYSSR
jgi:hypothetical protein